ncbi:SDR family NAD(P)-dependent oxidoreductase [Dactylosporangium sp. NPDC000521]|uniref:SDR family NAD(P)-dependent oxidoreductase n=1 Tax=Dactylosporangium sp. NPDC000521 TaxID=3363975 RepID=UPI00368447E3
MAMLIDPALRSSLGQALGLAGRTVVVTGANSGIGQAVALGLAELGVNVLGLARREEGLAAVAEQAAQAGTSFAYAVADVTDEASVEAAMDRAVETFGGLHGVVANAGIAVVQPALEVSADDFRSVVDTNLNGVFLTARSGAKRMTGGGSIVLTSSSFARRGFPDWSSYNASKAAVSMLAETLAVEWAPRGVRVNAIGPTATLTPVNAALFADPDFTASVVAGIPAGRILDARELILPTAFLLSPVNGMILGQTLMVDGGQTL